MQEQNSFRRTIRLLVVAVSSELVRRHATTRGESKGEARPRAFRTGRKLHGNASSLGLFRGRLQARNSSSREGGTSQNGASVVGRPRRIFFHEVRREAEFSGATKPTPAAYRIMHLWSNLVRRGASLPATLEELINQFSSSSHPYSSLLVRIHVCNSTLHASSRHLRPPSSRSRFVPFVVVPFVIVRGSGSGNGSSGGMSVSTVARPAPTWRIPSGALQLPAAAEPLPWVKHQSPPVGRGSGNGSFLGALAAWCIVPPASSSAKMPIVVSRRVAVASVSMREK